MRAFDFAPLLRSSVGFENLNRLVDFATRGEGDAYPPYNIEKLGEGTYRIRSEEHTSELESLMRISYAVFCLKKKHQHLTYRILYFILHYIICNIFLLVQF